MIRQYELVEQVRSYDPGADEEALDRAYVYAMRAHGTQTRASGAPYFEHPLEVAGILAGYRLDSASIVTALLHDTLEDTAATRDEIERLFGPEIAGLVDGVTKLSRLELQSSKAEQAENFRKLVLAMSKDIRVLLVKLADRLHNMRTLHFIPAPEKRQRIARETMEIYAPLAERIGMQAIKDELEDLAFAEINPDARDSIVRRLAFLRAEGKTQVANILSGLRALLTENGIQAEISGREKSPYSIWRKMQRKRVEFEMLADIMAFRVVVEDLTACYSALGVIHARYPLVPGRFKDYISTPKPNRYQSLHTTVLGPDGQRVEIQIRTHDMHDIAERGVAAHWRYKQGAAHPTEGRHYRWLQEILDILETTAEPEEFLEHTKLEMFQDQVFCFSPRGEVFALPRGATPIDFAYAVHSEIGDHCVGAKVSGRMVPLRTVLSNGDQVEILTSKGQHPSPEWEQIVATGKARSRIRRFVRLEQRREYARLGREILERTFDKQKLALTRKALKGVLKRFEVGDIEELYAHVGEGTRSAQEVLTAIYPDARPAPQKPAGARAPKAARKKRDTNAVPIRGLIPGLAVHFAKCCFPLPGDRIIGIVTTGKGVTIHTADCDTLASFSDSPERWIDVSWDSSAAGDAKQVGRIKVVLLNAAGSLGELATVISKGRGNISNLKITHRTMDFFDLSVDIEVEGAKHLAAIVAALRANPLIASVERMRH